MERKLFNRKEKLAHALGVFEASYIHGVPLKAQA